MKAEPQRYLVMLRKTATGYSADVPDLPGCIAASNTIPATKRLIARAIGLHLDLMRQTGEKISVPRDHLVFKVDSEDTEALCTWVEVPRAVEIVGR